MNCSFPLWTVRFHYELFVSILNCSEWKFRSRDSHSQTCSAGQIEQGRQCKTGRAGVPERDSQCETDRARGVFMRGNFQALIIWRVKVLIFFCFGWLKVRILEKWIKFWVEWTFFKTCVTCYATCPILAGATPVGAAMLLFARLAAGGPPAGRMNRVPRLRFLVILFLARTQLPCESRCPPKSDFQVVVWLLRCAAAAALAKVVVPLFFT